MSSRPGSNPPPAIFLSYAREDAAAVRRFAEALRAAGLEVWFDENELRGGDAWDKAIRQQVRDCTLFVPIISANTQARHEGYFRLEWHLAEQRSLLIAQGRPFIVPVCIDATPEREALVPEAFLAVQWMRLRDGDSTDALVDRVKKLLLGGTSKPAFPSRSSVSSARKARAAAESDPPSIPEYEMLRVIGRGSYGDVWLARGITGIYRAIKVVWRDRFAEADPFEREFKGLTEFAAISLGESIQMALLHIGRNEFEGYFYYVMELADDAERGRDIAPEHYVPLTLTEARKRRGRLPAAECVSVGVELARVLAGLHRRKLIHRDIKPSNIIFVAGVAKLADIGLVTPTADASTFVGTEGFVPPEGPGAPSADVFALGKLLYELSSGLDRQEFPKLPDDVRQLPDRHVLFELNEIILRACDAAPAKRYPDGAALLEDLLSLHAGASIRQRRIRHKLLPLALAAAVLVAAGSAWRYWPRSGARDPVAATAPRPAVTAASDNSIAVLPFENLSGDKDTDFFSDGIAEEILDKLANNPALRVSARTSSFSFRGKNATAEEIGRALRVAHVIEGSVRRSGSQVRITVQLINTADGSHAWSESFTREQADIFAVQGEIAGKVALRLAVRPVSAAPEGIVRGVETKNPAAYDAYLRGRSLQRGGLSGPNGLEMIEAYEEAVRLDPNYGVAWARLSLAYARMRAGGRERGEQIDTKIRNAAAAALRLAPGLPETHLAQATTHEALDHDPEAAERALDETERLRPNDAEALAMRVRLEHLRGHWGEETVRLINRAAALDPQNIDMVNQLGSQLSSIGRFAAADRLLERARTLAPIGIHHRAVAGNYLRWTGDTAGAIKILDATPAGTFDPVLLPLDRARMRAQGGDFAGAMAEYQKIRPLEAARVENPLAVEPYYARVVAELEARQGHAARARELLAEALAQTQQLAQQSSNRSRWAWDLALIHAARGEKAEALAALADATKVPAQRTTAPGLAGARREKAEVLAAIGEQDAAIAELRAVHDMGYGFGYMLRLELKWEPLRGHPKFQQLMKEAEALADAQPGPRAGLAPAAPQPSAAITLTPVRDNNRSIAVLPFENLSAGEENAYFAGGLHGEILGNLTRIAQLRVLPRTTVEQYRATKKPLAQIATELGVAYLLEGSVQRDQDRVVWSGRLFRAAGDQLVWADRFQRPVSDLFALQAELSQTVASKLEAVLAPKELAAFAQPPTKSTEAYQLFLKASDLWQKEFVGGNGREIQELLEQAVRLDPDFTRAWMELAHTSTYRYFMGRNRTPEQLEQARAAIDQCLRLAPDEAGTLSVLSSYYYEIRRDYAKALEYLQRAVQLEPNVVNHHVLVALVLRRQGKWIESTAKLRYAAQLDPHDVEPVRFLGMNMNYTRRYAAAAEISRRVALMRGEKFDDGPQAARTAFLLTGSTTEMDTLIAAWPAETREAKSGLARRHEWALTKGDFPEALRLDVLLSPPDQHGGEPVGYALANALAIAATGDLAGARTRLGDHPAALRRRLEKDPTGGGSAGDWGRLAQMEALLGQRDEVLRCAARAEDVFPEAGDALWGPPTSLKLASARAWVGDKDFAIAELNRLLRVGLEHDGNVHALRHSAAFFPLRGDPRFEALLNDPKNHAPLF